MAGNSTQTTDTASAETELDKPASIPAAKGVDTSGAPQQIVPDVDMKHPAVDDNPRANTTVRQNQIEFNDPTRPGHDVVADSLNAQGVPTKSGAEAAESVKRNK